MKGATLSVAMLVVWLTPHSAWAHLGGAGTLLASGMAHPMLGYDHLFAMVAIGIVSAELGRAAIWQVPGVFVLAMAAGALLAVAGVHLPAVEFGIATSVVLLGAAMAKPEQLGRVAPLVAAGFGLLHGYAHGLEAPLHGSPAAYIAGFLLTTAALHAIGAFGALIVLREPTGDRWLRRSGWAVATAGTVMLALAAA